MWMIASMCLLKQVELLQVFTHVYQYFKFAYQTWGFTLILQFITVIDRG